MRPSDIARFDRRGVKVINLPGNRDKYGEVLAGAFSELTEYIRSNVIAGSKVTEEKPFRELLLPRGAATRLCFFSLPLELLPFYREYVFPVVEEAGFVPVTAGDVVSPGDNISAKFDALIDRSAVMVTEIASAWTMAEFRIALARIKETTEAKLNRAAFQLIVVVTDPEQAPPAAPDFTLLVRPDIVTGEPRGFIADLAATLRRLAELRGLERQAEPQRLFAASEYRAAVISAMTLLEARLRDRLTSAPWPPARRPLSIRPLVEMASEQGILPAARTQVVDSWMRLRNEVVHSATAVSRTQARDVVEGVTNILETL